MKTYELTYIISPDMTSEEAESKSKEIESAIQTKEGTILRQSNPVAKTFAFPIGKSASGFFGILEFRIEPEKLVELKEIVSKDRKILRHMVIIKEITKPRKIRRPKMAAPGVTLFEKPETETVKNGTPADDKKSAEKEKVELKDIEEKLEELLG